MLDRDDTFAEGVGECGRLALEALRPPVAPDDARHGADSRTTPRRRR